MSDLRNKHAQKQHNNSKNPTLTLPQLQRFSNRHQGQHRQYLALQSLLRLGPYRRTSPTHSTPPSRHPTHTDPVVYLLLVHRGALTYRHVPRLRPVVYRRHLLSQKMPTCCVHRRTPRGLAVVHRGIKIQLLDRLAPPLIVTIDGSGGARAVMKKHWPDTKIQRCLVHVQRNILTDISRHPRYLAHKALRTFAYQLTHIETQDEACEFIIRVHKASVTFDPWLKEKTYRSQVKAADIPRWVTPSQKFWFTHRGARRSFNRLHELINDKTLIYLPESA